MVNKNKMPLFMKGAWLNLALVTAWFGGSLLCGVSNWLFIPLFAVALVILLFADWAHGRGKG